MKESDVLIKDQASIMDTADKLIQCIDLYCRV